MQAVIHDEKVCHLHFAWKEANAVFLISGLNYDFEEKTGKITLYLGKNHPVLAAMNLMIDLPEDRAYGSYLATDDHISMQFNGKIWNMEKVDTTQDLIQLVNPSADKPVILFGHLEPHQLTYGKSLPSSNATVAAANTTAVTKTAAMMAPTALCVLLSLLALVL